MQVLLTGATATEFCNAGLSGFDQGEIVTIPPRQKGDNWLSYDAARNELSTHFVSSHTECAYFK